jgi:hypothetical protein
MKKFSESTGHKDIDGNWVEETPQAKLRNQLGPFWTLIDILSSDRLDKTLLNGGDDLVIRLVNQCNENRRTIIELIKQTEK